MKNKIIATQAAFFAGMIAGSQEAQANNFSDIAANIAASLEMIPGLLTAIAYLFGLLLGVLGVLKIKDHVENPSNTPLKDGAVRMAAGGALFGLPIVYEAMTNTIGQTTSLVGAAPVRPVEFNVVP